MDEVPLYRMHHPPSASQKEVCGRQLEAHGGGRKRRQLSIPSIQGHLAHKKALTPLGLP